MEMVLSLNQPPLLWINITDSLNKKSLRHRKALFTPKSKGVLAIIAYVVGWGSGIRTPISTSRAWRAAVAPIPKI